MSDLREEEDCSLLCPICMETFTTPKTIAECNHSFCEQCLFTYVSTLSDKGELGSTFPCPVCRQGVAVPSDGNISIEWIQTFPSNEELAKLTLTIEKDKKNQLSSESSRLCDPCQAENEKHKAVKFCIECQEFLCQTCVDAHKKYKTLKEHKLVKCSAQEGTNELYFGDVAINCEKHRNREKEVYCPTHNNYFCHKCATLYHRECPGIMGIEEMESDAIEKLAYFKLKYEKAERHMDDLIQLNNKSLTEITDLSQKLITRIQEIRDKIVSEIDSMVQHVKVQINDQQAQLYKEISVNTDEIRNTKERCLVNKQMITMVTEYGHPVHKVMKEKKIIEDYFYIEKQISKHERNINRFDFQWLSMTEFENMDQAVMQFRHDQVKVDKVSQDFVRYDDTVNQMKKAKVVETGQHSIRLVQECSPTYTGVTVLDHTRVLLCDNCGNKCGHVCLYDFKSESISKLKMNKPFSASVLKSNPSNIAVSVPKENAIHVMSIKGNELTTKSTLHTDKTPYSIITLQNGYLGVTRDSPPSFDIVDVSGNELKIVKSYTQDNTGRNFKSFQYVAVDEFRSRIIQPCPKDETVYCFDFMGNPVFEYKDPKLSNPRGVAIDRDGNIYICSYATHTLHVLTPSGRKVKVIKEGIPTRPQAICFDETGQKFFLTSTYSFDKLWLFSLQQ